VIDLVLTLRCVRGCVRCRGGPPCGRSKDYRPVEWEEWFPLKATHEGTMAALAETNGGLDLPLPAYELRELPAVGGVDEILREKTVRFILDEQAREAL